MKRRYFVSMAGLGILSACVSRYFPDDGEFFRECLNGELPPEFAKNEFIQAALQGIDPAQIWDGHVHLIGLGDAGSGVWVNPQSQSLINPKQYLQFQFYLKASCPTPNMPVDQGYLDHLKKLHWGKNMRFLLLAFDYSYNEQGERIEEHSAFHTPNEYAAKVCRENPQQFGWLASVHPYRKDCVEALSQAVKEGALGVKWLPPAMGINPSSPLCDKFYEAMAKFNLPLLCHGGDEHAVVGMEMQNYGNPLLLRRALDHGVRVVVAHCASSGSSVDLDKGANAQPVLNIDLFGRLMDEPRYQNTLFGDISAMPQINRVALLDKVLLRPDWHSRLLYASDYPLPAVLPMLSLKLLAEKHFIPESSIPVLKTLRVYNPLLFDFVLKRHLKAQGKGFAPQVFQTRNFWKALKKG
jgi:mannonate dehydratase